VRLRAKLLLAQLPLGLALIVLGVLSVMAVSRLSRQAQLIFEDNYRSALAAQRMKEAIERLDSAALFIPVGRRDLSGDQIKHNRRRFESELKVQEGNLTEPGEAEATANLRHLWTEYLQMLDRYLTLENDDALKQFYFAELQPKFTQVKDAADEILSINQDAMVRKSQEAGNLAQSIDTIMVAATIAAGLAGVLISGSLTNRLLRPLSVLSQAVDRLGAGDFGARAVVVGRDEISDLAHQFNAMADSLQEYRSSSLGELLLAQRASQAAIDSIPDPVIVFTPDGNILKSNHSAAELTTGGHAELAAADLFDRLTPQVRALLNDARLHVLQGKGPYMPGGLEDAFAVTIGSGEHYYLLRATPVYEDRGEIVGVTVIFQDVTRLRRYDELKNNLVATVAGELGTPLHSLRMAIHLCLEGVAGPLTEKQLDLLQAGRADCQRLQTIVNELSDLARLQPSANGK